MAFRIIRLEGRIQKSRTSCGGLGEGLCNGLAQGVGALSNGVAKVNVREAQHDQHAWVLDYLVGGQGSSDDVLEGEDG